MRIIKPAFLWGINIICIVVGFGLQDLYSRDTLDPDHVVNLMKSALTTGCAVFLGSAVLMYAYSKLRPLAAGSSIEWYLSPFTWIGGVTALCVLIYLIST